MTENTTADLVTSFFPGISEGQKLKNKHFVLFTRLQALKSLLEGGAIVKPHAQKTIISDNARSTDFEILLLNSSTILLQQKATAPKQTTKNTLWEDVIEIEFLKNDKNNYSGDFIVTTFTLNTESEQKKLEVINEKIEFSIHKIDENMSYMKTAKQNYEVIIEHLQPFFDAFLTPPQPTTPR